jgi:hypothetical protein
MLYRMHPHKDGMKHHVGAYTRMDRHKRERKQLCSFPVDGAAASIVLDHLFPRHLNFHYQPAARLTTSVFCRDPWYPANGAELRSSIHE